MLFALLSVSVRAGTDSDISGLGRARACQYLAQSPSGLAKFGVEPVGLKKSAYKPCVMARSLISRLLGL